CRVLTMRRGLAGGRLTLPGSLVARISHRIATELELAAMRGELGAESSDMTRFAGKAGLLREGGTARADRVDVSPAAPIRGRPMVQTPAAILKMLIGADLRATFDEAIATPLSSHAAIRLADVREVPRPSLCAARCGIGSKARSV